MKAIFYVMFHFASGAPAIYIQPVVMAMTECRSMATDAPVPMLRTEPRFWGGRTDKPVRIEQFCQPLSEGEVAVLIDTARE